MILISAGHYPDKPGACFDGFCEHYEAVAWASLILEELSAVGMDCAYVPTGLLASKVGYINLLSPKLAVEVHFNADLKHRGSGCETLYFPKSSKGMHAAELVQTFAADVMGRDRGIKPGYYQMDKKNGVDYFLRGTRCPSIIVEPEFIHNHKFIAEKRQECCEEIAKALAIFASE